MTKEEIHKLAVYIVAKFSRDREWLLVVYFNSTTKDFVRDIEKEIEKYLRKIHVSNT